MSYILDALRKADAQRVRDPARGIHAQAAGAPATAATQLRNRGQWLWGAVAVLILAAAAWLWVSAGDKAPPPEVAVAAAPVAAPVATPVEAPRIAAPAAVVLPAAPPVVVAAAPEVRRPPVPSPQKEEKAPSLAPAAQAPAAAAAPALPAPVVAAPAAAADRVYSVAELPADVRQALPRLTISGGVYSENVAQRMLVVGGQVFNEGSEIAPGVVLEQIRPKSVLLKFRGLRITQPY